MSHSIYRSTEILPSPGEIKQEIPLSPSNEIFIQQSRNTVREILEGRNPRLLAIVGPCSIHDPDSALEFARRLNILQKEIGDTFFLIMRVYTEKSRTKTGWKGMLNDPHLDGSEDIALGLRFTRQLLVQLSEMNVPTATEFLDPFASRYYEDLITWGCIGARTSESQTHRLMASGLPMPIAFKNSTQGNIDTALNGIISASVPHRKMCVDENGKICVRHTLGNRDLHIALRGGRSNPNYEKQYVDNVLKQLKALDLPEKILIDCSHDNSPAHEEEQKTVFLNVMEQISAGNKAIRGIVLESHLEGGRQPFEASTLRPDMSVTDPCLAWDCTEKLLQCGARLLNTENSGCRIPEPRATCAH